MHGGDIYTDPVRRDFSVNLNPVPCPEAVIAALEASLQNADKYPDLLQREVRRRIAQSEGVKENCVLGGNGASELLPAILRSLKPRKVLLPRPGFSGYLHAVRGLEQCEIAYYDLREEQNFILTEDITDRITEDIDLVIVTNPNNPTGCLVSFELMQKLLHRCEERGCALLADECFLKLSEGESLARFTEKYKGLYVLNAYTKLFSLPGVRIGYVITSPDNITDLQRQLPEWNMSVMAQQTAAACADCLTKTEFLRQTRELIRKEREYLLQGLRRLGLAVYASDTSFLLLKSRRELREALKKQGILIRSCEDYEGLSAEYYRVAVKNREQNDELLKAIEEVVRNELGN